MKVDPADTHPAPPAASRRHSRRRAITLPADDRLDDILFEDENPIVFNEHHKSALEKFEPTCSYDRYLVYASASNTYRQNRFAIFERLFIEESVAAKQGSLDVQFEPGDTHQRAPLALRDQDVVQTFRFIRDTETVYLRRALLLNREIRMSIKK